MLKIISRYAGLLVALALPMPLAAQQIADSSGRVLERCRENPNRYERYCEVRDFTISRRSSLTIPAGINGDVTVHGWRDTLIHVVATVRAEAMTAPIARGVAMSVQINAAENQISAHGPSVVGTTSWSVSYELWVPVHTDLRITSVNGSLSVDGVDGRMDLESTNGTLSLSNLNGDVRARTSNGGVSLAVAGDRWIGAGLDASTLNGPVEIIISSAGYSAALEASTVTGRLTSDLDASSHRAGSRTLEKRLGRGGPPLRLTTINGAVSVHRN